MDKKLEDYCIGEIAEDLDKRPLKYLLVVIEDNRDLCDVWHSGEPLEGEWLSDMACGYLRHKRLKGDEPK